VALNKLAGLHPALQPNARWAVAVAQHYNVPVNITSVYRPTSQQRELYDQYRRCVDAGTFGTSRCPTKWPANPPGQSAHEYGLAWDSTVAAQHQAWWNRVRELAGFRVLANDVIHAELPDWRKYVFR
jgi:hypothetical protein